MEVLKFEKITSNAYTPIKSSKYSAGYDLFSAYNYCAPKHGKQMIKTDIRMAIPLNSYGRIAPRSGLAWYNFIDVGAGVVDSDFRGNICIILYNFSNRNYNISHGDRVAQLIIEKIANTQLLETTLANTDRNENGFGSTGK